MENGHTPCVLLNNGYGNEAYNSVVHPSTIEIIYDLFLVNGMFSGLYIQRYLSCRSLFYGGPQITAKQICILSILFCTFYPQK